MGIFKSNNQRKALFQKRAGYPARFTIDVVERIMRAVLNQGGMLFDPFSGSASSGIAAYVWAGCLSALKQEKTTVK